MSIGLPYEVASSDPTDARSAPAEQTTKVREYPNRSRVKLAYTTIWSLDDMLKRAKKGRAQMEAIRKWIERERLDAKGRYDGARLERLGELNGLVADLALEVGELERLAADARIGIYDGPGSRAQRAPGQDG